MKTKYINCLLPIVTALLCTNSYTQKVGEYGNLQTRLQEYAVTGKEKKFLSPYTVSAGGCKQKVELNKNIEITCTLK